MTAPARTCSTCRKSKPVDEFYLRRRDEPNRGRDSRCRDCVNSNPRTKTTARALRNRARHRATAALLAAHADEFNELLEAATVEVHAEAAALGTDARLKPGRRRPDEQVVDRLDVARCSHCIRHHDRGHACTSCGHIPTHTLHRKEDGVIDEIAIERRIAGKAVALTTAELGAAARLMRDRGYSSTQTCKALRLSGARLTQLLAAQQIDVIAAGSSSSEDVAAVPTGRTPAA